jgi:DNA-directed RNA polymerase subunit RPC12/RpoP
MNYLPVQYYANYIEAHIAQGKLQEEGISCWLKDENTVTLNPLLTIAVGSIKLMVAETQLDRAKELLSEMEKEKRNRFVCPKCGSGNIELVTSVQKRKNLFRAIAGLFLVSYPLTEKIYHCFNCSAEFEDPIDKDNQPLQ